MKSDIVNNYTSFEDCPADKGYQKVQQEIQCNLQYAFTHLNIQTPRLIPQEL